MRPKTVVAGILQFFILHLVPRSILAQILVRKFEIDGFRFTPEFSGRVALFRLAGAIRRAHRGNVALIPDYICNVVNMALEEAGFEVRNYATDERFEPIRSELEEMIRQDETIGILLTASIYGSSAFLQELRDKRLRALVLRRNIHLIVDLCQNISLVDHLPTDYGENLSAVVSFNDKSFPGLMGGGTLTRLDIPPAEAMPSFRQTTLLYRTLIRKLIRWLLKQSSITDNLSRLYGWLSGRSSPAEQASKQYAYSYCRSFPYDITERGMATIQIIAALIGLRWIPELNSRKRKYAVDCPEVVLTRHYDSSPYLVVSSFEAQHARRRQKLPYAIHRRPGQSLRSHLKVIHNKGFCDTDT